MVVAAVDHGHTQGCASERLRKSKASEPGTDDHDVMSQ
jgi:hypothetical protein